MLVLGREVEVGAGGCRGMRLYCVLLGGGSTSTPCRNARISRSASSSRVNGFDALFVLGDPTVGSCTALEGIGGGISGLLDPDGGSGVFHSQPIIISVVQVWIGECESFSQAV